MTDISLSKRVLLISLAFLSLLVCAHLLFQHLNLNVYEEKHAQVFEISNRLDFDDEHSIPTWFSQFLYVLIGLFALWLWRTDKAADRRYLWLLISFIGFLFSLDEVAGLHETLLQILHILIFGETEASVSTNAWLLILPFIAIAGMLMAYFAYKQLPRRTFTIMLTAGITLVTGAVFIDMLNVSVDNLTFMSQGLLVAIEETLEISAAILVLYGLIDYAEKKHPSQLAHITHPAK